jgi:hypothetical protein
MNLWYRQVGEFPVSAPVYYFRLVDTDFTPRLAYRSIMEFANELQVAGPGTHQETSPAVEEIGVWTTVLQSRVNGNTVLKTSRPGDKLRFGFAGTGVALLHGVGPTQGRITVTIDGEAVGSLPRDQQDRSYLDLYAPVVDDGRRSVFALGLRPGQHTLELQVEPQADPRAQDREVTIDGFAVELQSSPLPFYQALVAAGSGLLLLLLAPLTRSSRP